MSSLMMSALIAIGATSVICFALIAHVQNGGRRRSRAGAGADGGDGYSGTGDGFSLGNWFFSDNSSVDGSGNPADSGSCSFSSAVVAIAAGAGTAAAEAATRPAFGCNVDSAQDVF
ncbi:hypothetical protein [Bradyrhizobium sp. CB82]|uniref:hypothetical protein n=1 Tax=Bradyrhizobium sp. CB82 TaxID=3039159 RepID=UPI0032C217AB